MNRVVHFEIQVDNPKRAIQFYQNVFGWKIEKWTGGEDYWFIMTADKDSKELGINGGLLQRKTNEKPVIDGQSVNSYVCTIQVDSYDDIEKKILTSGGKVALPKFALVGMAWQGYYKDTEGNIFGIHQPDNKAK